MRFLALTSLILLSYLSGVEASNLRCVQDDSLQTDDTIHLTIRRYFLSTIRQYNYHYASYLSDAQLIPLLRRTPDPSVRQIVRRGEWKRGIATTMSFVGATLAFSGLLMPAYRLETRGGLLLSGVGLFYGSLIPAGRAKQQFQQAVAQRNLVIRNHTGDYYAPITGLSSQPLTLSLSDTVSIIRRGFTSYYSYRQIRVQPAWQLVKLADRLNNKDVKDGLRYSRHVGAIAGFIGSFGAGYMTTSLLFYGTRRANGGSATLNTPLFWGSLAALSVNVGLRMHISRVQQRTVQLLNERLRDQYGPSATNEHFLRP
ncbi:hypothetical protein ACFSUS_01610 [Spirosoma soli]|uniref:Transmembrane protein n=1 Tax=Spirosoma soli TaxID=1770529 RepID=A0ABW5LZ44_9BACT